MDGSCADAAHQRDSSKCRKPQEPRDVRRVDYQRSAMLSTLHNAMVRLVQEIGISGLVEVANSVKMTMQVGRNFGTDWRDIFKQAAQDGVSFPVSDDVLRHVKGFM